MPVADVCDPWPLEPGCCDLPDGTDEALIERCRRVASTTLFRLSGRRYGPSCPVTVRPCARPCIDAMRSWATFGPSTGSWTPYLGADGVWRNASSCGCRSSCSCTQLCEVRLDGPVYDVTKVLVDGVELVPEAYRVDVPNLLVRTDGESWPECQDMAAPCGEPGTVCVTYRIGLELDEAAIAAVSELTCELVKACIPGSACKLPGNTTRLARQGATMAYRQGVTVEGFDPTVVFAEGRTGLPGVDMWIATVNPYGQPYPSRAYSPDLRRPRMQQWP